MSMVSLFPLSERKLLEKKYVGQNLKDVATPAAVLDLNKIKRNCTRMLKAVDQLQFGWRVHIKTHKTNELTELQVGEVGPVNIIVSTVLEAEQVLPLLLKYKKLGRDVNLLYSFPFTPASVERLALFSKAIGPKGLSLLIDHPSQLESVRSLYEATSIAPEIFIKVDMGYNRAGVVPQTEACSQLITSMLNLEAEGMANLLGLYAHAGQSYSGNDRATALDYLRQEFESILVTAESVHSTLPSKPIILSVGATPTSTSIRNLFANDVDSESEEGIAIAALKATILAIRERNCKIEIHAGVYPVLDLQQLATNALTTEGPNAMLTFDDLALTVIAEIASVYPGRGADGTPEALIGSGSLALGREPCKAYPGWAIVTPWNRTGVEMPKTTLARHTGWTVGRISQEHGVLTWNGAVDEAEPLEVGMKVRLWPNHACVAGAGFGWYLVVDSSREGREDEVIDVWPRWRGW
ncbi:hypothetical protein HYFRA_00012346 [Hymenoscyphus fraxineus]|uniref:D-serine dehydratase n=1 Tax=Hymenoscyphus fraxineus TaxID=746836 RepID=A0A9N9KZF6_9HELO|nr:hypothetical protein HYFRA_00012346 [Hymenoscyphus fraxineus]